MNSLIIGKNESGEIVAFEFKRINDTTVQIQRVGRFYDLQQLNQIYPNIDLVDIGKLPDMI